MKNRLQKTTHKNQLMKLKYLFIGISILCVVFVLFDLYDKNKTKTKNKLRFEIEEPLKIRGVKLNQDEFYALL